MYILYRYMLDLVYVYPTTMDKMVSLSSGGVAQLGERYVRNVQARGSNPLISTIFLWKRGHDDKRGEHRAKDQRD